MLQIRLIGFRFSHNSNPRMGTDFVSETRKDTFNSSFLCSRVSEHLPITEILQLLKAKSFKFTGTGSGCGLSFWQMLRGTLHFAPVSILYKIRSPLEVRAIDQTELSFFLSFMLRGSWIISNKCLYKKYKIRRLPGVSFDLLNFVYLFLISRTTNLEMVFSVAI